MNERQPHILVVDDDDRLRALIAKYLREQGFIVNGASSAQAAREVMALFIFDAMVLDVMMPGETGIEFVRSIGALRPMPVLMLSARGEVDDRILGLEAGADDYLAKPFEPKELVLRLRALMKRQALRAPEPERQIRFGEYTLDTDANRLLKQGEPIYLTTAEMALLKLLAERPGEAIAREELARLSGVANERGVDVQITRLRKKIEREDRPLFIQTVRGAGYGLFGVES